MTGRPKCPSKRDSTTGCNWPGCQVCRLRTDNSTCCVAATLEVDECYVLDWAIALNGTDDAFGDRVVVWVTVWLEG